MTINTLAHDTGPKIQFTESFRSVLEDHMSFLRMQQDTSIIVVEPHDADKWKGDLFGYLTTIMVPVRYHWVIMRMNTMLSPNDFNQDISNLLIPSYAEVDKIQRIHQIKTKTTM